MNPVVGDWIKIRYYPRKWPVEVIDRFKQAYGDYIDMIGQIIELGVCSYCALEHLNLNEDIIFIGPRFRTKVNPMHIEYFIKNYLNILQLNICHGNQKNILEIYK